MKNINKKVIAIYVFIIGILLLVATYAINNSDTAISVSSANIQINYNDNSNGVLDTSNIKLVPILDSSVANNTENVLRISFSVAGINPPNKAIYDISLKNLVVDNHLLSHYTKWKLIKNNELISEGSLSPFFDIIRNNRLALTNIQQDLTNNTDNYEFVLWLSDSCQNEDITKCIDSENQDYLYNKNLSGKLEIEAYISNKKKLVRKPKKTDAVNLSYDDTNTSIECLDAQCMIDYLNVIVSE